MLQTKVFLGDIENVDGLEERINSWLARTNKLIRIKSINQTSSRYYIWIVYHYVDLPKAKTKK